MKNLLVINLKDRFEYILPDGMNGLDWTIFKRDYSFILEKKIAEAKHVKLTRVVINTDLLPVLVDDLQAIKTFMDTRIIPSVKMSVVEWNERREEAKQVFTAPCIFELDGSGFISKVTRR